LPRSRRQSPATFARAKPSICPYPPHSEGQPLHLEFGTRCSRWRRTIPPVHEREIDVSAETRRASCGAFERGEHVMEARLVPHAVLILMEGQRKPHRHSRARPTLSGGPKSSEVINAHALPTCTVGSLELRRPSGCLRVCRPSARADDACTACRRLAGPGRAALAAVEGVAEIGSRGQQRGALRAALAVYCRSVAKVHWRACSTWFACGYGKGPGCLLSYCLWDSRSPSRRVRPQTP